MAGQTPVGPRGAARSILRGRGALLAAAALGAGCTAAPNAPGARETPTAIVEIPAPIAPASSLAAAPATGATATEQHTRTKPAGARIHAKARFVWIHPAPVADGSWIGYLTLGGSAPLRGGSAETAKAGSGPGCDAWYGLEPRGFVCLGDATTLDPDEPTYAALARDAADVSSAWPYEYGESIGTPRYAHLPTETEQRATEWDLVRHLEHVRAARAATGDQAIARIDKLLVGVDLGPAGVSSPLLLEVGAGVRESRAYVAPGSTIAYTRAFDAGDRAWLLTSDHALVPRDRVRRYPRSEFHGVELGHGLSLPIAFVRKQPRPKYRREGGEKLVPTGETWPRLAWLAITGDAIAEGGKRFLPTAEEGTFAAEADVTLAQRADSIPFTAAPSEGARTWIDVSVAGGWLVAYEEREPVFATLISPGRGGTPYPGLDPLTTASTPTGTFRVDGKFKTATMVSSTDDAFVHSEVQYVQNFHGPHALHGAYWHDAWGEPKSGGCVNLSPLDAKRMFEWTEPRVPEGWHGLRSVREVGRATVVVIHR